MRFMKFATVATLILGCTNLYALPALQLGGDDSLTYPNGDPIWTYDFNEDTWVVSATSFDLLAFANQEGGKGGYAWASGTALSKQYAYLVAAAVPDLGDIGDVIDISIYNNSLTQSAPIVTGYGNPPIQDQNHINNTSLSPHGVYDTYFEIYEFVFDELGPIFDLQPGGGGNTTGFSETFSITINSLAEDITGVHFDLFTVNGGRWDYANSAINNDLVNKVAPFSHDAEYKVPEPGVLALFSLGIMGLGFVRRRRTQA